VVAPPLPAVAPGPLGASAHGDPSHVSPPSDDQPWVHAALPKIKTNVPVRARIGIRMFRMFVNPRSPSP
jgi:hypothetical protein